MKTKLILIGGVPGTGKTTIAYNLALHFKIDKVISLDIVKAFAKFYRKDKYLYTTTHEAYKLDNLSIIDGYLNYCNTINNIALDMLNNINDNFIIMEGATLNKEIINKLDTNKYEIYYFNLTVPIDVLKKRYVQKKKLRNSNWIENISIIEMIDKYLCKNNINIINIKKTETTERIINYVEKNICI